MIRFRWPALRLSPEYGTQLSNPRTTIRERRRRTAIAARQLRLIGMAAMIDAVRETWVHRLATEMEIGLARMAQRPFADAVVQVEQAGLARNIGRRLCRHQAAGRGRGCRRGLITRVLAHETAGAYRSQDRTRGLFDGRVNRVVIVLIVDVRVGRGRRRLGCDRLGTRGWRRCGRCRTFGGRGRRDFCRGRR